MTKNEFFKTAKEGVVRGFFWSIGVTAGFTVVTTILIYILSQVSAFPIVGSIIANIVQSTLEAMSVGIPGN